MVLSRVAGAAARLAGRVKVGTGDIQRPICSDTDIECPISGTFLGYPAHPR